MIFSVVLGVAFLNVGLFYYYNMERCMFSIKQRILFKLDLFDLILGPVGQKYILIL
jgi:hypothetical protein